MRKFSTSIPVIVTLAILPSFATAFDYFDDASNNEIITVYNELNGYCRGGSGEETFAWCGVRDLLYKYMITERNLCFGKEGQISADMTWHKCGRGSLR